MAEDPFDSATDRLHRAIADEAMTIGPHEVDDAGGPIAGVPLVDARLQEWVLVIAWSEPTTSRTIVTRVTSDDLPKHHEKGLLHEALYSFE